MTSDNDLPTLVAAVDNDRMALLALKGILPQLLPGARWVWEARTADEAVRMALDPQTRPKLLLVDMSLGETTGVSVCRAVRTRTDRVLMLAVTAFATSDYADRVAAAGAQGIVSKADVPRLAAALRTVAAGGVYDPERSQAEAGSPRFRTAAEAHRLLADATRQREDEPAGTTAIKGASEIDEATGRQAGVGVSERQAAAPAPPLAAKEEQTLRLLAQGLSYEQIAKQWSVAAATVRTHAHRAVEKLGANSLAHAIALYLGMQRANAARTATHGIH